MGLFSYSDQELSERAISAAQSAWDDQRRVFACRLRNGVGSKNDPDVLLNLAVNGIVAIGWELHSLTPFINTIGPNNETVLLTFQRP